MASNASAIPSVRSQRLDAVSSPQAVARSVEEIASKLLMITEVKVGLRKRGLITVREGFPGHGGAASDRATALPLATDLVSRKLAVLYAVSNASAHAAKSATLPPFPSSSSLAAIQSRSASSPVSSRPEGNATGVTLFLNDASQPLSVWRKKGWIYSDDPRGWFHWYCRYYMGRRMPDEDARQIKRWKAIRRHIAQIRRHCEPGRSNVPTTSASGFAALGL